PRPRSRSRGSPSHPRNTRSFLRGNAVRSAPVAEPRPRAQIFAQLVEALLDLGSDGPVAVAAVAEFVDGRRFVTANALLEHCSPITAESERKLRFLSFFSLRKCGVGPRGSRLFG